MAEKERGAEDFNPKHRILGAIILVAAAVIVVPLLLKQHQPPTELSEREPARDSSRAESPNKVVVTPVTPSATRSRSAIEAPPPAKEPAPVETPAKTTAKSDTAPSKPEAPAVKPVATKPPAKDVPAGKSPSTAELDKGWIVQVGTFASADNANRLSTKLKQHGHRVLTETISLDGRSAVRLRVGPYGDKSAALKAQARIEREEGIKGVVLAYP